MAAESPLNRRHVVAGAVSAGILADRAGAAENLLSRVWDYVIVGGGSAGCVLARRLSEDPNVQVLLIEAGGEARDPAVFTPQAWPALAGGAYDWKYESVPQVGLDGRTLPQPRGKGLGGSTLINAMGFQRGPRQAYDRWATETGDAGWGYDGLLPYFKRLETASGGGNAFRGGDGPLHVLQVGGAGDRNPLAIAIAEAGLAAGFSANADWNGARADGVIWTQLTIADGKRDTAASAFVDPVRARPNLGIQLGATVTGLRFDRRRCVGVDVLMDGASHAVTASRDVILSAGAVDSPRLLMLSGIGPADELKRVGIAARHDLPGVGRNLHDHPLVPGLLYQARQTLPVSNYNHGESMIVASSRRAPGWTDLMFMGLCVPFLSPTLGAPPPNSFSIVPALTYVRSRGTLKLSGPALADPVLIDPGYLSDPADVEALVDAVEIARTIAATAPLTPWIEKELFPGAAITDRKSIGAFIRRAASPFFHLCATCRMGAANDSNAVVDPACRVRGVEGLRVVDASIFPSIPQAMTNAGVLAVAERAADLIRGRTAL